jgi:uncharacterized membrane protein YfcA
MATVALSLFALAVFLLAGLVKGVIGMGLPTIAMGLLTLALPPAEAAALLLVPSLVTNLWQLLAGPALARLVARLAAMLGGIVAGTLAGSALLVGATPSAANLGVGLALIGYAAYGLAGARLSLPSRHQGWLAPAVGLVTGLASGATGVFVLPAVPYLQAIGLDKDELVQALGLSFTVSTVALGAGLLRGDALSGGLVWASILAVLPALAGMALGQLVRRRIGLPTFRRAFFAGLLVLGACLALRTLA